MAVDITTELHTIGTAYLGEEVRMAIADAMEKIMPETTADISSELDTIRYGRYGSDIRSAIYRALDKLRQSSPEYSSGGTAGLTVFDFTKMRLPNYNTGTVIATSGATGGVAGATTIIEEG